MKAQQDNTRKDFVFTFAGGRISQSVYSLPTQEIDSRDPPFTIFTIDEFQQSNRTNFL